MTTGTPNKTILADSAVLTHQVATHPVTIVGPNIPVTTKRWITLFLYHGYIEAADDSSDPGRFIIQSRPDAGAGSVDEHWATVTECVAVGANTAATEQMHATEASGVSVLAVTLTSGFAARDNIYIEDVGTLAASEWAQIQRVVTDVSIDIMDGLTTGKDASDFIWGSASRFVVGFNCNSIETVRVIWQHQGGAGADGHVKALAVTYDSDDFT